MLTLVYDINAFDHPTLLQDFLPTEKKSMSYIINNSIVDKPKDAESSFLAASECVEYFVMVNQLKQSRIVVDLCIYMTDITICSYYRYRKSKSD